jgi:hypothetical protein
MTKEARSQKHETLAFLLLGFGLWSFFRHSWFVIPGRFALGFGSALV